LSNPGESYLISHAFVDFLAGHVDPGEDVMQTAIRETEEEAGLSSSHYEVLKDFEIFAEVRYVNFMIKFYMISFANK